MASLNLLEGYGSDDSESSSETIEILTSIINPTEKSNFFQVDDSTYSTSSGDEGEIGTGNSKEQQCHNLKNPFRTSGIPAGPSVFANPYKEAEDAEKGTLEKHVKFAPKLEDVKEINGRKVCWNYRKGRCRFGSNCVFAHDSELLQKPELIDPCHYVISSPDFDPNNIDFTNSSQTKRSPSSLEKQDLLSRKRVLKKHQPHDLTLATKKIKK